MKLKLFFFKLTLLALMLSMQLKIIQWYIAWKKVNIDAIELFALISMSVSLIAGCILVGVVLYDPSYWNPIIDLIGGMAFVAGGMFGLLGAQNTFQKYNRPISRLA